VTETELCSRSAVMAVPAAKEMGPTNRQQRRVFPNGVLRLETYVNKIRANLYSGINLYIFILYQIENTMNEVLAPGCIICSFM
jgi:hypothetical protein